MICFKKDQWSAVFINMKVEELCREHSINGSAGRSLDDRNDDSDRQYDAGLLIIVCTRGKSMVCFCQGG